ncbi:hypothetical protein G6F70_005969 [Rhizopus microsporus]|uniref:BTB domain-containing protein n=2 Tax=Rhizopus TaxID=4842 RepID=A0A367JJD2_RHIAZ|nr:hypothetical protein G6F71_005842 [Rhizopus microsporus]RCH90037.1 hypothetical protein CU097_007328 [Rhizopus azygosporus]KAG1198232.1 hypothetical protein G6F70_005969 [Rhizopus microsporus]KAG1212617.1 hypothetical protein G6F69_003557 [Rhizopus microsporus]KAG1234661.1 hypothetical protein G6F67_003346 [Rhizopus microsporus]
MNSPHPNSPHVTIPSRDRTPSSNGALMVEYSQPIRTTGERLGSLVGASLTTVGDSVYVFGGFDQYTDEIFNKLYKLEYKDTCHWTQVIYTKGEPPIKRHDHSATLWNGNKLIIFGGNSEEDRYFNDIVVLDLDTLTWYHPETAGFIPEGRIKHSATIFEDKLYIAGGVYADSTSSFADTLLVLNLRTWEWERPIPFTRRAQHMSFVYNKRLYLYGGLREDMSRSNDFTFIDLYRPDNMTQLDITSTSSPSLLFGQRFAQICGDQLVVLVTIPFREAVITAPATGLWTLDLSCMQWQCRELGERYETCSWHCFSMTENDKYFYLFGTNEDDPEEFYSMTLRVDLEEVGVVPVPPPQLGHDLLRLMKEENKKGQEPNFTICSSVEPDEPGISVHRLILLARWPYFVSLWESGMSEAVNNKIAIAEPLSTLRGFVKYLYSDSIEDENEFSTELVSDLLVMAHIYMVPRLSALCVRRLFNEIDIETASKIYHSASLSEQKGLQQAALHYIFQHFGAVSHTAAFRSLPRPILFQIWDYMPENASIVGRGQQDMYQQSLPATQIALLENENREDDLEMDD